MIGCEMNIINPREGWVLLDGFGTDQGNWNPIKWLVEPDGS
jgi:hypothetical protein